MKKKNSTRKNLLKKKILKLNHLNSFKEFCKMNLNVFKTIYFIRNLFFVGLFALIVKLFVDKFVVLEGFTNSEDKVKDLTDRWITSISSNNDGDEAYQLICSDGKLVGTVDSIEKNGEDIKKYFNYFAKLPNIKVKNKKYNISEISKDDIYTNTAYITWEWDDLEEPLTTKIQFTFKDKCIHQIKFDELPK